MVAYGASPLRADSIHSTMDGIVWLVAKHHQSKGDKRPPLPYAGDAHGRIIVIFFTTVKRYHREIKGYSV